MKKLVLTIVVAVLVLGTAGYAYAQTQAPATPTVDATAPAVPSTGSTTALAGAKGGHGLMGSTFGAGMMGSASGTTDGVLHDYLVQAFVDAVNADKGLTLTVEEITARLAAGETLSDIAISLGYTLDEFRLLMDEVLAAALSAAVADGAITQEQADWMLSHMMQTWQGDATGKNWGGGGQMGSGQMSGTGTGTCTMSGGQRGSGQGVRGSGRNGTGTCTQTP